MEKTKLCASFTNDCGHGGVCMEFGTFIVCINIICDLKLLGYKKKY